MDSIISLGQKNTLAEYMILSSADNRPPMLDKDLYDSWKSRMELYMQNREHGRMILESVEHGLPADIYSLVNHHRVAKDLWERVQLLMQGTSLTKQERECKLYDAFDKFTHIKGESLHTLPPEWSKFVTDVKLVKDLHTSNFDQLHAYLEQHELHANEVHIMRERNQDPLAFVANQQMTPPHFNTYQSYYNNPQLQQQFSPSQHGSIQPNQHYSSHYPSQTQFNHSSIPPSHTFQSQINHQTSTVPQVIPQVAYQSPQAHTQPMTESPFGDSGFAVPVFSPGDDPIACLNKAMAFLTAVASLRGDKGKIILVLLIRAMLLVQGEILQVDRQELLNATTAKEKAMLAEAQEAGQILDEEQITFLADLGISTDQAQTIIPHNAAFQTEDLDTYDSDCDDLSTAQAVLMANISNYGSDIISEVPNSKTYMNDMNNQSVHALQDFEQTPVMDFTDNEISSDSNIIPYSQYSKETQQATVQDTNLQAQQDSMILSVIEQMSEQMINHVNNWEKANKEQKNESITAELERYKERVKTFEQRLNIDLSSHEKMIDSQMDDMIREKLALKEQIDSLEQNLSKQIKEKESLFKTFSVFKNESKEKENKYMENEIDLEKKIKELDNIICKVGQSAQTVHMLTKPQIFLNNTHKEALGYQNLFYLKKAQQIKPTLYDGVVLSNTHVAMHVIDDEETLILEEESRSKMSEKAKDPEVIAKKISHKPIDYEKLNSLTDDFEKLEVPSELPKVSLVNASLKKLKVHLTHFDSVVKKRTTPNAFEEDVLLTVINTMSWNNDSVNIEMQTCDSCEKCLNLDVELSKSKQAYNDLLKNYSQLEKHCISLEASMQLKQEVFQNDESCVNHNGVEIQEYFEINDLKARLQDKDTTICKLKDTIRSLSKNTKEENVNHDKCELEPINEELENSVAKLLSENKRLCNEINHVKQVFKDQFDSIKQTRIRHKEQSDSLINKLNLKSVENEDLKAQNQDKVFVITSLKNNLRKLKGKEIVENVVHTPSATTIAPGMFKLDLEPLPPSELDLACKYAIRIQELLLYVQDMCPNAIIPNAKKVTVKPMNNVKKVRFAEPLTSSNNIKQVESSNTSDSNTPVLSSTGVKCSTRNCRSKLPGNKKNDRISQTPSRNKKNKVEAQPRKVNNSNRVVKPVCDVDVKHSLSKANSKILCATCNKSMFDGVVQIVLWYLDSGCSKHMTGNRSHLINFVSKFLGTVRFGNDQIARIIGYGDYQLGNVIISRVYYVEGLGHNLFSVGQFCDADLEVAFRKNTCFIRNLEGVDLLSGSRDTNLYTISLDDMLKSSSICLLSKASKTKSWLWHRRLSHLNFVIVDNYSRFTWVKFLKTKDEALAAIIKCIKNIQVRLKATVQNVRTDNGTTFVNQTLREWYENVGITHQTSVARTPQQNGVVERRNRTLVEAARTMLIFSKAPLFLWAEAINTTCYTQNHSLIRL
ncbi:retrovirus-related pol polyprotein from transposon TNT 1-94 [Tanacetum coccineum]